MTFRKHLEKNSSMNFIQRQLMSIDINLGKVKDFMSHDQLTNMVKVVYVIKGEYIGTCYLS